MTSINMDNPVKTSSEEWAASTANALEQAQATPPSVLEQTQPEARNTEQFTQKAKATPILTGSTPDVPGAYPATGAINKATATNEPKAAIDHLAAAAEKDQEGTPYQVAADAVENIKQYLPAKDDVQRAVNVVSEAAEKMVAQLGLPIDVTEPKEVDSQLAKTPDTASNTANASSVLGTSANNAVVGVAGALGVNAARSESSTVPDSALPSESVISAVNMDTPQLRSSAGADYMDQSAGSTLAETTFAKSNLGDGRPEVAPVPGSALPSSSVIDAVQMDTPKTEAIPYNGAEKSILPPDATTKPALEKSDSDFPLPKADTQIDADSSQNGEREPVLNQGTQTKDQPTLNAEPSKENKHVTEGGRVQLPDEVPISGQPGQADKGLQESPSGISDSKSNNATGTEGKKVGKAHRFMEKMKDKLHIH